MDSGFPALQGRYEVIQELPSPGGGACLLIRLIAPDGTSQPAVIQLDTGEELASVMAGILDGLAQEAGEDCTAPTAVCRRPAVFSLFC